MRILPLAVLLLARLAAAEEPSKVEATMLGDWCAGSESAFHEQFSLSIDDGVRRFESWLHERPAESGTWELTDRSFTIHGRSGHEYSYKVVSSTPQRLVLEAENSKPEVYVREGCVQFEAPPKE